MWIGSSVLVPTDKAKQVGVVTNLKKLLFQCATGKSYYKVTATRSGGSSGVLLRPPNQDQAAATPPVGRSGHGKNLVRRVGMTKLLLQLQAAPAAERRHALLGAARRHQLFVPVHARHVSPATAAGRFTACFLACLLALAAATTLALALTLHCPAAAASPRAGGGSSDGTGYSVVINTWKRYDLLRRSVAHYSGCAGVDAVHVVWSEPREPPGALRRSVINCSRRLDAAEVQFVINEEDSLNNRFRPIQGLGTDAVFSVDDDLIVPCSTLRFAFAVWQSAPSAMVGFVPRMHWLADPSSNLEEFRYGSWWSVWWTGTYSMVLSKASFFHRRYLDVYTNHMMPSIRDYINENRNCEDIAMSFLVANVTAAPPIWVQEYHLWIMILLVMLSCTNGIPFKNALRSACLALRENRITKANKGRIFEIGSSGISSLKGHDLQRSRCLNIFAAMYGHMPLVATTVKAVDSRTSWFW